MLVPADIYRHLQSLLEEDVRAMEPLLADLALEDWEDESLGRPPHPSFLRVCHICGRGQHCRLALGRSGGTP